MMGAIVRHCVGKSLAKCSSFSSSSRVHSVFFTLGSSHSYHRALHCFGLFLASRDETRAQLLRPYFITAALRISSSEFFQTPPLMRIRIALHGVAVLVSQVTSFFHGRQNIAAAGEWPNACL